MADPRLKVLIADDNNALCHTIEQNIYNTLRIFEIEPEDVEVQKAFTHHAFDHGCEMVKKGFIPDICFFDLVFNGNTGIDLYKFIMEFTKTQPQLCIYTGVEKTFEARENAEILASESGGNVIVIPKPNILRVLRWLETILELKFSFTRRIEKDDPFDLL